jgi:RNA polymerase sigma-54 factor
MALLQTLKQTQNLSLTPQLLQSIKILQLSSGELHDYLVDEIEQNPLLEAETELYRSFSGTSGTFINNERGEEEAAPASLQETLFALLMPSLHTNEDKKMGETIIYALDEAGYLTETNEMIDEAVLQLLQDVAPAGVGARNLRECLMLQLKAKGRYDEIIAKLLDNLALVAKRDYAALKKLCQCDDDDMAEMIKDIRELDPKPGLAYAFEKASPPAPDVIVRIIKTDIIVQLNPDLLPRVSVNKSYIRRLKADNYVKEMSTKAYGLIKMLDQRFETLIIVASEIMKQQEAFLRGTGSLAPMTLKMVAEQCEMHESTVSRAVTGKIAMLPQGVFELKYFFTNAVNDEGLASDAVRTKIKYLIETEIKVLSDDDLVLVLKSEGMNVARRTISKYREGLGIPSSMLRKREKSLKVT